MNTKIKSWLMISAFLFAFVFIFSAEAQAATYYVDATNGNDANAGTSTSMPWKTINKVNNAGLQGGDSILFKRGEIWDTDSEWGTTSSLKIKGGSSDNSRITYGAYGEGNKPKLNRMAKQSVVRIEVGNVTVQDMELMNGGNDWDCGNVCISPSSSISNVTVKGCDVHDHSSGNGIGGWPTSSSVILTNILITQNNVYNNIMHGIVFERNYRNSIISHNTVHHNGIFDEKGVYPVASADVWGRHGISLHGPAAGDAPSGITVEYNEVYDQRPRLYLNTSHQINNDHEGTGIQSDDYTSNSIIRYNFSHDNYGSGVTINKSTNISAYYNILTGNGLQASDNWYGGITTTCNGSKIYNNVLANNKHQGIVIYNYPTGVDLKNNIFYNNDSGLVIWEGPSYTSDYNLFYPASQKPISQETHSLATNPLFINPTSKDFHLQSTSPAIDKGVAVGLASDFASNAVPQGVAPDIGAYEVGGIPPPPPNQTPFPGPNPISIPGTIELENYDKGGEDISYHDLDAGNAGGAYRADDVDIEAASEGGYDIGWLRSGEWLEYSVNVSTAGIYDIEARVASMSGGNFHVEFDGVDKTGTINLPNTGGWQTWASVYKTNVSLSAGQHIMKLVIDGDWIGNMNYVKISQTNLTHPPSDLNADNLVNLTDFNIIKTDFLKLAANLTNPKSDIDTDGRCTIKDVGILMSGWK